MSNELKFVIWTNRLGEKRVDCLVGDVFKERVRITENFGIRQADNYLKDKYNV